ncbi:MAG: efflux RND transporter periplasmic adaptor subunit [Chloroflexi bacterium]|nr:efflux RND transporter periplasmic adaptor subunit [Chloroflexota bacterium]
MRRLLLLSLLIGLGLSACTGGAGTPASALPTLVLAGATAQPSVDRSGTTASGTVVPAQEARLSFLGTGLVSKVSVRLGDVVQGGDVLIELDDAAAQRDLARAESELADLTSPAALARARQAVARAEADLEKTRNKLEYYVTPGVLYWEEHQAEAQATLAAAKTEGGSSPSEEQQKKISDAEKSLARAVANLAYAQKQYREVYLPEKFTRVNSQTGESYVAEPRIDTEAARADYELAGATLSEARAHVQALSGEATPSDAFGSSLALLELARRNVAAARTALEATRLEAPFAGTIALVSAVPGENAVPGAIIVIVSDLSRLHVETTDLSERDVTKVSVGQAVRVYIEALGEEVSGRVSAIAPGATALGGDVVYKTVIDLDEQPQGMRAGMSAEVTFQGG